MKTKKFRVYPFKNLGWLSWLNILDLIHIYLLKPRLGELVKLEQIGFYLYTFAQTEVC